MTAVYMRVSARDQRVDAQRLEISKWLEGRNERVDPKHWFIDEGVSGKSLDRPAFNRLCQAIFNGEIHAVVIYKLDRIARKLVDGITTLADWLDKGVRVVAVAQQMDYSGTTGKLIAAVLFGLAEIERESLLERQAAGIAAARAIQDRVKKLHVSGFTAALIADTVNRPVETVERMIQAPAGKLWWGRYLEEGDNNGAQRAHRDQRIRMMVKQGLTTTEIGRSLGFSRRTVVTRLQTMGGYSEVKNSAAKSGE